MGKECRIQTTSMSLHIYSNGIYAMRSPLGDYAFYPLHLLVMGIIKIM